jgi:hypothetical protein
MPSQVGKPGFSPRWNFNLITDSVRLNKILPET